MQSVVSLIRSHPQIRVGLSVWRGDRSYGWNDAEWFHPASTFKVLVMVAAFDQGILNEHLLVRNEFASIADASPFAVDVADDSDPSLFELIGGHVPARDLVERMIVRSSNLATNLLMARLTPEAVQESAMRRGIQGLKVIRGVEDNAAYRVGLNNAVTARGLVELMWAIREDAEMMGILLRQEHRDRIPALLPCGVAVANKTGWVANLNHDCGIVDGDYAVAILTEGFGDQPEANRFIAELSRAIYDERDSIGLPA